MTPEDQELLEALSTPLEHGLLTVAEEPTPLLLALEQAFPFEANRLAWWLVPGAVAETAPHIQGAPKTWAADARAFAGFLERIAGAHGLAGNVAVLGDGFVEVAVLGELVDVISHIPIIASFPQHTYVFPFPVVSWAAGLSMEGEMHFAHAPPTNNQEAHIPTR